MAKPLTISLFLAVACVLPSLAQEEPTSAAKAPELGLVTYNAQVRPILAKSCFACHGPDEKKREAKLRLDVAEDAFAKGAWKPGKPDESEGIKRIFSTDKDEIMPPPDSLHALSEGDRNVLRAWVQQGANYEKHWAFVPPVSPKVPELKGDAVFPVRHPIDAFVLDRLAKESLQPSAEAPREQWLRRVTLDLTGLPPSLAEIDDFLADKSDKAYETVVDRLLASSGFGERMATDWLDAARYADSYGRHEDAESPVWPYRDWVVKAFNDNLPYDRFLLWQTAGDMLPDSTQEMKLATVFNRLVNQSNEAGSNEEEFRQELVADRVKTNATAILGLTMECARCHDHKSDPISTKEYYSFAAYLNNIDELGLYCESTAGISAPSMYLFNAEEEKAHQKLLDDISKAEAAVKVVTEAGKPRWEAWKQANGTPAAAAPSDTFSFEDVAVKGDNATKRYSRNTARPDDEPKIFKTIPEYAPGLHGKGFHMTGENNLPITGRGEFRRSDTFSLSFWIHPTVNQERAVLVHRSVAGLEAASRGYEVILDHMHVDFGLSHVAPGNSIRIRSPFPLSLHKWNHIAVTYDGSSRAEGMKMYINSHLVEPIVVSNRLYKDITYRPEWGDFDAVKVQDNARSTVSLTVGNRYLDMGGKEMTFDEFNVFPLILTQAEVTKLHCGEFPTDEESAFQRYLRDHDADYQAATKALHAARTAQDDFVSKAQEIMVMHERKQPRETFVQTRGQFDQRGEKVTAATPKGIWEMPAHFPQNRLGLAKWYIDAGNPLTARVAVNRYWQNLFGKGIVSTQEDFGVQGQMPTHPQLLDWLACDFRDNGWDVKRLCRNIVLSSTYRQDSRIMKSPSAQRDPLNELLSRGPSHRLQAEMLRDLALKAADMLNPEAGGKPVKTYQPEGLYRDGGVQLDYYPDHGSVLWKRSVYLFRKRTMPLPFLTIFDASTREFCRVRRESTATPLQALALLNAPDFVEPCRVLAEKQLAGPEREMSAILTESFRRFTARNPQENELAILTKIFEEQLAYYTSRTEQATALLSKTGEWPVTSGLSAPHVAALTMVHRMILNDDDTIMKK